jgi:hypothetical protein
MIYDNDNLDYIESGIINFLEKIKFEKKIILIKYKKTEILNKLIEDLKIKLEKNSYLNNHQINFIENEELEKSKNSNYGKYNLVFDLLLENPKDYKKNLVYLNKSFNYEFKNHLINFYDKENAFNFFKYKLENLEKINIQNICSKYFYSIFLSSKQYQLNTNIRNLLNGIDNNNNNNKNIKEKKKELINKYGKNINIDILIDLIGANKEFRYKIFKNFLDKNSNYILGEKDLKISMLTGEKGYIDFILIPPIKQREEYIYLLINYFNNFILINIINYLYIYIFIFI